MVILHSYVYVYQKVIINEVTTEVPKCNNNSSQSKSHKLPWATTIFLLFFHGFPMQKFPDLPPWVRGSQQNSTEWRRPPDLGIFSEDSVWPGPKPWLQHTTNCWEIFGRIFMDISLGYISLAYINTFCQFNGMILDSQIHGNFTGPLRLLSISLYIFQSDKMVCMR